MKRFSLLLIPALCLLSLTSCEWDEQSQHINAHIAGYVGVVDKQSESLSGLNGYQNISTVFYVGHDEYRYFVPKYIFANWGSDGPSGKAQFFREGGLWGDDWMIDKTSGSEVPFTKEIVKENGYMRLADISWQQPWKGWKWKIHSVSNQEIVLISDKENYFFRIVNSGTIEAEEGHDIMSTAEHDKWFK